MFCWNHTKHQTRDWLHRSMAHKPWIRVGTATLFTLIHDAAGLFSASTTIGHAIHWFSEPWQNILAIIIPIVFFDCTSELMLIHFHDLPLCQKKTYRVKLIRIALVGQIITALAWLSLLALVIYYTIFSKCLGEPDFFQCHALMSGISSSLVVFLVFIRNAKTLKEYNERVYIYPIICDESLLFLYHFARNKPNDIVSSIEQFHSLNRTDFELDWKNEPTYQAVISFVTLLLMDAAGISSVLPLIMRPDSTIGESIINAIPFVVVIIIDIASELLILVYHDLFLCDQEEKKLQKPKNRMLFNIGRVLQILVNLAWIATLIYMVHLVVILDCKDICQCIVQNTGITESGVCLHNYTIPNLYNSTLINCTITSDTKQSCLESNPTWTGCLLLGIVITDAMYSLMEMFFRSNVLPITLPDFVLYLLYWMNENTEKIVIAIGRHEFGFEFTLDDLNVLTDSSTTLLVDSDRQSSL